jgi:hypothetical protein
MEKKIKHLDIVVPKYAFAPITEEEKNLPPVQRKVFKTMEVTESFTVYDVFKHLAKMDRAIADKEAEIASLEEMKKSYMEEMIIIEKQLGIEDLEQEFRFIRAAEAEAEEKAKKDAAEIKPEIAPEAEENNVEEEQ